MFAVMVSKSCLLSTFQYFLSMFFCVDRQNQVLQAVLLCMPCSCNSLCLPTEPYKNPKQNMLSIYSPPLTLHRRVEVSGLVSFYKFCGRGEREVSVKKWKAVNSVQAILDAIKFRETTPNRNTPILVHALVSGDHQLWTQNYW